MRRTILPSSADGLAQRLRRMEQEIADLQSVRGTPPRDDPDPTPPEAFSAYASGTLLAAAANVYLTLKAPTHGANWFFTSGVTGGLDTGTQFVTVPAGLWLVQATVFTEPSGGLPTSGHVDASLDPANIAMRVPWRVIADGGGHSQVHLEHLHHFSAPPDFGVYVDNSTNASLTVTAVIGAVRLAEYADLTLG